MKITISGIGGVGKGTTAKLLGEKLDYKVVSGGNFFRQMAKELKVSLYEFDEFVKKNPEYDQKLDSFQKKFGEENDNFILESRIGWFFVPDSFKIKLICDEKIRIDRIIERDGGELEEIKKKEAERLSAINQRYKELYGIDDFRADKNFDLIVNTSFLTPQEVVEFILKRIN